MGEGGRSLVRGESMYKGPVVVTQVGGRRGAY